MPETTAAEFVAQGLEQHRQGQLPQAEVAYRLALAAVPTHPEALHYLGIIAHQTGRLEVAFDLLTQSVQAAPERADFLYNLANAYHETGRLEDAIAAYRRAIDLEPRNPDPFLNLSVALQALGRFEEAATVLRQLLVLTPDSAAAYHNLGLACYSLGQTEAALTAFRHAIQLDPTPDNLTHLGSLYLRTGYLDEALATYQQAIDLEPARAASWNCLGQAHAAQGHLDQALAAYRHAQQLAPDDPAPAFALAALAAGPTPPVAPRKYVADLFDSFAETFDQLLVDTLHYRTPQHLQEAVTALLASDPAGTPRPPLAILDAGCGTGLCAPLFAPLASTLTGIDLSPAMLQKARQRNLYHHLFTADLTEALLARPDQLDLILAADVFPYLGDLAAPFAAAATALRPAGLLAFSVETHTPTPEHPDFILQPSRRYAHALAYLAVAATAAGLRQRVAVPAVLRLEKGEEVHGHIVILQKS